MQQQSLVSMVRAWREIPSLTAISDGSVPAADIAKAFAWWPAPVRALMPRDVSAEARSRRRSKLADWAERAVFGLKFAAVVNAGHDGTVLFCDADILWFRDIAGVIASIDRPGVELAFSMAEDYQPAYDQRIIDASGADILTRPPYRNSGIVYLRGDLLGATDLMPAIAAAAAGHFAEQTAFAVAAERLNSPIIPRSAVACHQHDADSLAVTYRGTEWVARHYVGPVRNLFWRDALALRLGITQ